MDSPFSADARDLLSPFAELVKSPEYVHTYRITPLSLWNAASCGISYAFIHEVLSRFSRYPVPENLLFEIREYMERYGKLWLEHNPGMNGELLLRSHDEVLILELLQQPRLKDYILGRWDAGSLRVAPGLRGHLKQVLIREGFPVEDRAGYEEGDPLDIELRPHLSMGEPFTVRYYQNDAAGSFWAGGSVRGGSGVIVLPCGAGKTVVGMLVMTLIRQHTLILVTNTAALHQWRDELLDKTSLRADQIGEFSGEIKEFKPVTISTYHILTYRKNREDDFIHMHLFNERNWGLVVYDEVHLLPAPVFRFTAEIQTKRRLGLTATLVREDGREDDVFSLIGPKKHDVPWKVLEQQGWIAHAECAEIRIPLPDDLRMEYAVTAHREKYRVAASNPSKIRVLQDLIRFHTEENILIIGQYLDQLEQIRVIIGAPLITGRMPNREREVLYEAFRVGKQRILIVSKVANFAIDLPAAGIAIQVSGTFGSRQEEAQRLGRILRPKSSGRTAWFYSLVTRDTHDQKFAHNRQLFLTEQGYRYHLVDMKELDQFLAGRSETGTRS
ncbi:helicase-associated domain-containing protein [bacterium]|nr:helicase-associated domain-containing protein [candidate division CSSED10-310 bacterium]